MMTKRKLIAFAVLILLFAALDFYYLKQFSNGYKEFRMLSDSYNARLDYNAGSRAYGRIIGEVSDSKKPEALYNLANISFREGISLGNISLIYSSIEYYKEALRMNPKFVQAKKNLEIAQNLEDLIEKSAKPESGKDSPQKKEDNSNNNGSKPGLEPYEQYQP